MRRLLLIALVVAGCSSASATVAPSTASTAIPSAASQSSATSAPTVPIASATPDIKALASTYLQLSSAANAKLDVCNPGMQSSDLATVKSALGVCIDAFAGMNNGLAAVSWGPVQPKVDDLISADAKAILALNSMKSSASLTDMASYVAALQTATGDVAGASAVLRAALGLPQVSQPS
jgi:hypothetical protein